MNTLSSESIIEIIINSFNYDRLKKEYFEFVSNLNDDEIDLFGDDYTSCWLFAYYIHKKLGFLLEDNETKYVNEIDDVNDFEFDIGIYSFFSENNTEFHHFILFVTRETVRLLSTYGGQEDIIDIVFTRGEFENLFRSVFSTNESTIENKEKYQKLFGIEHIKKLDLSQQNLRYNYKSIVDY